MFTTELEPTEKPHQRIFTFLFVDYQRKSCILPFSPLSLQSNDDRFESKKSFLYEMVWKCLSWVVCSHLYRGKKDFAARKVLLLPKWFNKSDTTWKLISSCRKSHLIANESRNYIDTLLLKKIYFQRHYLRRDPIIWVKAVKHILAVILNLQCND